MEQTAMSQALAQAGVIAPAQAGTQVVVKGKAIDAIRLKAFDTEVSRIEGTATVTAINALLRDLAVSTVDDVREATKGYLAAVKGEEGWKKGQPQTGRVKSASNRAGEIKAVFGALTFCKAALKGKGYTDCISAARDALIAKAILWDGEPVPTEESKRKASMVKTVKAAKSAEAGAIAEVIEKTGEQPDAETQREITETAATAYRDGVFLKFSAAIWSKGLATDKALNLTTGTTAAAICTLIGNGQAQAEFDKLESLRAKKKPAPTETKEKPVRAPRKHGNGIVRNVITSDSTPAETLSTPVAMEMTA